ncbi:sulfatase-like hydrolase/transferase [Actinomadura scrupuli]|uniref:sulfatase-like hydrolase/transferase n=1 Tax=Actinomadura scrupuli TaxID=559629 RepID=UPI003D9684B3
MPRPGHPRRRRPSRRQFLTGTTTAISAAALTASAGARLPVEPLPRPGRPADRPSDSPPNLVVIILDDLGYGEIGAYGQRLMATPRMDRLAAEGLRFTEAYASSPICAPSRCSLLTGMHTGHATVRENPFNGPQGSLVSTDTTFAELVRARGYRTACIGKWGFGPERAGQPSHPNERGFEEFFGYITHRHAHQYYPQYLWHNGAKVPLPENAGGRRGGYAPDLFRDHAVDFITGHSDEPFLLYLSPNLPHAPSDVPSVRAYAHRDWTTADKGHAEQVTLADTLVGTVIDTLRAQGLDQHTIVMVSSDNGPHEERGVNPDTFNANGPLRGGKRNVYEGGVRIPLIAWAPGRIAPGTSHRPTSQTDLLPTLAELAGAPAPRDVDGVSIVPLLTGRTGTPPPGPLYWYRNDVTATRRESENDQGRSLQLAEALRQGDWKAVRFAPGRDRNVADDQWQVELYDLRADPGERFDVADRHPDIVRRLVALMRASWVDPYPRHSYGLRIDAPEALQPGRTVEIAVTLSNGSGVTWSSNRLTLRAPEGWEVRPLSARTAARLAPGEALRSTWRLTAPADAATGRLRATGSADTPAGRLRFTT